jgi:preprotein translocase subunit SecB
MVGVRRWKELVIDRKKMEGHCSTGQSPQRAVAPMEEEEEVKIFIHRFCPRSLFPFFDVHVATFLFDVTLPSQHCPDISFLVVFIMAIPAAVGP